MLKAPCLSCRLFPVILFGLLILFSSQTTFAQKVDLTEKEQQYLASKPFLTVGAMDTFVPFNFTRGNVPSGYSIEYLQLVGDLLGKEVKFVVSPWSEQLKKIQQGP